MLTGPKAPPLRVGQVVPFDITPDILNRARSDGIPNDLLAAYLRSFVHCKNHLVASRSMVDLRHPRPNYMDSAEDDVAILFPSLNT